MINTIETKNAPAAIGPYSQAKEVCGLIFTSGQIPLNPQTGDVVGGDVRAQTHLAIQNLEAVLKAAGSCLQNVVKTTCFLQDMADFSAFNEIYAQYFDEKPARSCVAAKALPRGVLVEVEAIAVKSGSI